MTFAKRSEAPGTAEVEAALRRAEAAEAEAARLRDRLDGSQEVTAALVGATRVEEVLDAIIDKGLHAFGARAALVRLPGEGAVRLAASRGFDPEVLAPWLETPVEARTPTSDAFRTGEPVWLGTRAEFLAAYPELRPLAEAHADASWAAIPLRVQDRVIGVLGLSFAFPTRFELEDRRFIVSLARKCGQALESARLHEAERAARSEAEALAAAQARALELEAAARSRAEAAEAEARRIGAVQEQLLAVVGHDLRTPLSVITLGAKMLERGVKLDAAGLRTVRRIEKSAARMSAMIRDLLDFSRARRGQGIPCEPVDVDAAEAIRGAVSEARAAHPGRAITFDAGGALRLRADPERLAQLTTNLVVNALEHGPAGEPVDVALKDGEGALELSVHNGGSPIPESLRVHLFEPFVRGRDDDAGGHLGLGLFIVREIVTAHGGTVDVRSAEGAGTTFVVRLPR